MDGSEDEDEDEDVREFVAEVKRSLDDDLLDRVGEEHVDEVIVRTAEVLGYEHGTRTGASGHREGTSEYEHRTR